MPTLAANQQHSLILNPGDKLSLRNNALAATPDRSTVTIISGCGLTPGLVIPVVNVLDLTPAAFGVVTIGCQAGTLTYSVLPSQAYNQTQAPLPALQTDITSAQQASPTPDMLADTTTVYRLNVSPFTRYVSDGSTLQAIGSAATANPRTFRGVVASQAAMLALATVNQGDWCERSDLSNQIFELTTPDQTILGHWTAYPSGSAGATKARVASNVNVTVATPGATVDGVSMNAGDIMLLVAQSTAAQNGPYVWNGAGTPATRLTGFTTYNAVSGATFAVTEGTVYGDTFWQCSSNQGGTIDVTALAFVEIDFSPARVLATTLTGLDTSSSSDVIAADTVIGAFGKLQAKFNAFAASVRAVVLTGIDVATIGAVTASDSILVAIGKLQATIAAPAVDLGTGTSGTLTTSANSNRPNQWRGTAVGTYALPSSSQTEGDLIEVSNNGTARLDLTGGTASSAYKMSVQPGETFYGKYTNGAWKSQTINGNSAIQTVTVSAGHATLNLEQSSTFMISPSGSFTLDNPTNLKDGQVWQIWIKQPVGGSAICTFDTKYQSTGGIATCALSTAGNALDMLTLTYNLSLDIIETEIAKGIVQ